MQRTRSRITRAGLLAWVVLAGVPFWAQDAALQPIAVETALYAGEGVGLSGLLSVGTPVELLEQRGPWVKIRVEGWVRQTAVAAAPGSVAPVPSALNAPAAPPAAAPRAMVAPGAVIEGSVRLAQRRSKSASAAGVQLWLLPAAARTDLERESLDSADAQRLESLDAEAARLRQQADRALQELSNFTEATRTRDALLARRKTVLDEREQILAARHGRHEAYARRAAVSAVVADARGWFSFADAGPGAYTIYGRMIREGLDVEWIENVEAAAGTIRVDLDETSARGLLREPS